MTAAQSPSCVAQPPVADAWERTLLDRQLETLDRLAEMGMAIAGAIARRATEGGPDADLEQAPMDFARVSRAVRMTLALQSKLVRDFKTPPKGAQADNDDDDDDPIDIMPAIYWADGTPLTKAAKKQVLRRSVRDLAEDRGLDSETVERLEAEAVEQMEREDLYPNYPRPGNRPFNKVVAQICEDLGLKASELEPSFPLEGGRDGMGVNAPSSQTMAQEAAAPLSPYPPPSG